MAQIFWHHLPRERIIKILKVDIAKGLSEKEVSLRQKKFGQNKLPQKKSLSSFRILLSQLKSPLIYILIVAALITLAFGEWTDSLVIFIAVFINTLFGFWEENKISRVLEKLKKAVKTKAVVLREGKKKEVFQEELVPGDVIFLETGNKIPADARLIKVENLKVSEAVLTGESVPSAKAIGILPKRTPLSDRENMVYLGCLVESGEGKAVVTATGERTETGKIATLLRETEEEKSPLQKKLAHFSKLIGALIGLVCLFIFIGGSLREGHPLEMFEAAVAIAVGGIPEALPVVMTLILAIGMEEILKKKGLVRKLNSVETLGSTQIICFDKTRTLTEGKMVFSEVLASDKSLALKIALLCNEAFIENPEKPPQDWKIKGPPTDASLIKAGAKLKILKPELEKRSVEISKLPFDSTYKYELSLRKEEEKAYLYISGAPERILAKSLNQAGWQEKLEKLTEKGLRVIGVGYKKVQSSKIKVQRLNDLANNFTFAGLIALEDPLRADVQEAIKICQMAGMKPILVTGDHRLTAQAIAQKIGLQTKKENILEGTELDELSEEGLAKILEKVNVYARVEPRHKMKIISAFQKKGKVVAMTGDGVNDAPALKKADIGLALGSGTEVAKESSDIVLLNDSFTIIVKTIKQGRIILDNLRKSIAYILADSFSSVILVGFSKIIFGWPLPILPVQILWNNFVEDTLPDLAYAFEPEEKEVMKRRPSSAKRPLLTKEMKILIFGTGLIDEFLTLSLFWYLWGHLGLNLDYVRTMIFGALCLDTAFVVYCYKDLRKNIWQINPLSNQWLNLSSIVVFTTFALAVYLPPLQKILHTVPLNISAWLILIGIGIISMLLIESTKWYFINRHETEE